MDTPERRSNRSARSAWFAVEATLGVLVFFCPLALATVHPIPVAIAAVLALAALGLAAWACLRSGEAFAVPAPAAFFAAAAALIAFQLVPLPPFAVGLLAPRTRELFEFSLGSLGLYPAWRPLSLDPAATALELVKALTGLAAFLAASQFARSRRARRRLVAALGLSALTVALIGYGHALWGATALFGTFRYTWANPPFLTTFGNPNHLASFLALGATALLARVLSEKDRKLATIWAFGYFAAGVAVLLTLSRGGVVAFLAAQLLLAFAVRRARRSERDGVPLQARSLVVPSAVLVVVAVAAYLAWDALAQEWASSDSIDKLKGSKIALWPSFAAMLREHWLVGVGRGAFQSAYTAFQDPLMRARFTHPESLLFQWTTELGLPMGLALLGASAVALGRALRHALNDIERLACAIGVACVALHDVVDFALELGGLAVPAAVAFGIAAARSNASRGLGRRAALALVPAGAVVVALAMPSALRSLEKDGVALAERLGKAPAVEIAAAAAEVAQRHPADYLPHLVAAQAFEQERPLRPASIVAWANRAMYLAPGEPLAHRLAARALRANGRAKQARIEYRLAWHYGDREILPEIVGAFRSVEDLREAMPDDAPAQAALADELLRRGRVEDAEGVARAALEAFGERPEALQRLARIALERKQTDEALALGSRISAAAPERTDGLMVRVSALTQRDLQAAARLLEVEGLTQFPFDSEIVLALASLRLDLGDPKGCREALRRLPTGLDVGVRVRALGLEARAAEREGQGAKAVAAMRSAVALQPDNAGLRWGYALLLERTGRPELAVQEARRAAATAPTLEPEAAKLRERVEEQRKKMEEVERWREVEGEDR